MYLVVLCLVRLRWVPSVIRDCLELSSSFPQQPRPLFIDLASGPRIATGTEYPNEQTFISSLAKVSYLEITIVISSQGGAVIIAVVPF